MPEIYRDIPVGFHRVNRTPLDDSEIINGNANLFSYIESGTAYHGQKIIIRYDNYDQPVMLKKGRGTKLIPIMIMPSGYEFITKVYNGSTYALVYYYNGGSLFTNVNQNVRLSDSFAWSLLPQASLFANSDTSINYLLEVDNDKYTFTQANFATNTVSLSGATINKIASTATSVGYYPTGNSAVVIMPRTASSKIVKLWVKCTDYLNALGE